MTLEWTLVAELLALGCFTGFLAGLLGIGGGMLMVPFMTLILSHRGVPAALSVKMAIATSMATILFTSISSVRAHHKRGAVRWDIVRGTLPGILLGTLLGTVFADAMPSRYLAIFFTAFVYYSAVKMWLDRKPKAMRGLPGRTGLAAAGLGVGAISSLVGAGGGVLTIPMMTMCNVPMLQAIGTSAALGLPIAAAGTLGYVVTGLNAPHVPAPSLGYVYLPALVGIVVGTFVTVPFGARAAHRLPVPVLKRVFAVILFLLATKMLWTLL